MQQTPESLCDLIAQVAKRDRQAFAELYKATSLKLYGVVLRILRRAHLAEDILQEVYVKVWEKAGDFDASRGSPITWMATIARNRALDEARRRPMVSSEDVSGFENIASDDKSALEQLERSEDCKRLYNCLGNLDADKRRLYLLAYHHGLTREVLAQKFDKPVATIKTWLRRSLESLKQCLDQ